MTKTAHLQYIAHNTLIKFRLKRTIVLFLAATVQRLWINSEVESYRALIPLYSQSAIAAVSFACSSLYNNNKDLTMSIRVSNYTLDN